MLVSVVGFVATLINVWRSRTAAEQATAAARQVRQDLGRTDAIAEFGAAISAMEEVKRLHRQAAWSLLPERYSALRKSLVSIRSSYPLLSDEDKAALQGAIQQLIGVEESVETMTSNGTRAPDVAKLNRLLSRHTDKLQEALIRIRLEIGS